MKVIALDVEDVRAALRPVFAGRPVILAGPALTGGGELVRRLGELDAGPVLALTRPEAAADADAAGATVHAVDVGAAHSVLTQRRWDAILTDPPPDVLAALDRFDPGREALVLIAPWCVSTSLGDRRWVHAARSGSPSRTSSPPRHCGTTPDSPAPAVVVDVVDAPAAATELDRGQGTVWAPATWRPGSTVASSGCGGCLRLIPPGPGRPSRRQWSRWRPSTGGCG